MARSVARGQGRAAAANSSRRPRGRVVTLAARRTAPLCWGAMALALQGCSLNALEGALGVSTTTRGEVQVRSATMGETVLKPEACISGDRGNFRGVDLVAPPLVFRVVAEPLEGLAVALIDIESGDRRGVFRRRDCTVLRGDVQRTGWRINNVTAVSGFVELDCRLSTGEAVSGSVTFESCH